MSVTLRGQIVEVFKYCWQGNLNWPLGSCQLCHPLIKVVQKAESRKQKAESRKQKAESRKQDFRGLPL